MIGYVLRSLPQVFVTCLLLHAGYNYATWQYWFGIILFFVLDITSNIAFVNRTKHKDAK